ncbi:LOW QUALITY PROTEIN: hypothetical protein ACG7TL_004565 [Trametes sanguinea]
MAGSQHGMASSSSRLKEIPDTQPVVVQRYGSSRLKDGGGVESVAATSTAASHVELSQYARRSVDHPAAVRAMPVFAPSSRTTPATALIDATAAVGFAGTPLDNSSSGTPPPTTTMNPDVEDYWNSLTHVGGVFRLDREQFVLQEWDSKEGLVRSSNVCLHQDIIRAYISELEALPPLAPFPLPEAVFLQATPFRDAYVYSCVSSGGRYESGKRVIVSYQRDGRPDLGSTGIFNWNNRILFTHELLNAYTNTFTASETPFSAFCLTVRRQYEDKDPKMKFCSDETFVRAWFAFVQLQDFGNTMVCPTCGPSPAIVIADGVTLATHASKLTAGVRPPTLTDTKSEVIGSISSYKARGLAAITQKDVRTLVIKFIESVAAGPLADMSLVPDISSMAQTYPALSTFLRAITKTSNNELRRVYRDFARQIAAPDIVLQLVPYRAISEMLKLAQTGIAAAWLQAHIPALGRIIAVQRSLYPALPMPDTIRAVAQWLANRAADVYARLAQHDPAPTCAQPLTVGSDDWRVTGTCYGLPAIRTRRVYSKLRHDGDATADINVEDAGECNKFFKTYPRNKLAGGILALWCTHSICLGFHTIPIAEGRNDVFSAIYTRFPTAPEVVIYDFACQLAPYCYIREARYFANTRFLIDELHARDHTKCGQACFASNMMQYDDRIRAVNTSAAECGNGGAGRIRKSVSYMSYKHAVVYTKVFMDVQNRIKSRRLAGSAR